MGREKHKNGKMDKRYKQVFQNNKITVGKKYVYGKESIVIKEIQFVTIDELLLT